jgi:hypothetical protein
MNSEIIRFTAADPDLTTDGFSANVVVTLEKQPAGTTSQDAFDRQRDGAVNRFGVTDVTASEGTVCGQPMRTLRYTIPTMGKVPPHPAMVQLVYLRVGDVPYVATVTLQSVDADNPTYQKDAQDILHGFQMLPPA